MTRMIDWRANLVDDDGGLRGLLSEAKTVAVIGAKAGAHEPAFYVPAYLAARGYTIRPVNPTIAGHTLHGARVAGSVTDLDGPVDVVQIFRRPEYVPGHAREILALPWRPKAVWLQLGIRHDGAAELLARAGLRVVQDRCMMPEHRRLLAG
jgi:predicted CoA-binding protein